MSVDYVSPECTEYLTAPWPRRQQIAQNIREYTLGLFKWLQTDPRVPSALKASVGSYGLCADEFGAYGGFSPQLYIRESRRLVGDYVMNETHMTLDNGVTDEIALGYYTADTHVVQNLILDSQVKNEGPDAFNPPPGYKIPYRILLPKASECTNLLATFCVSASHAAFASLRVEPVLMALGQAAGIAAALAVHRGLTVHNVPIRELKNRQDIHHTVAERAVVLDVSGAYRNGRITQRPPSSWTLVSDMFGYVRRGYFTDGNTGKGKTLTFTPDVPEPGSYRVDVQYPTGASVDADRSNMVPVTITHAAGTTRLTLDQTSTGQGGDWDDLGVYPFDRGSPGTQTITIETNGTDSPVVMNAVKLVKV